MKQLKYRTVENYAIDESCMEFVKGESATLPDEPMSLAEILARAENGVFDVYVQRAVDSLDFDDHDAPDLEKLGAMDLVERAELHEDVKTRIRQINERREAEAKKALEGVHEEANKVSAPNA